MVYVPTSVGDSEFDARHFSNRLAVTFYLSRLAKPSAGAGDMPGNASYQANSTLITESFF
jgi:hypothetical protein